MRDLNEDDDSRWSHHLHDNGHRIWQCNRNPGYDKDSIKRTMLMHNATFRKQVYELHRIYNRHKELMDELRKERAYGYSETRASSQSNSLSSQTPFDGSSKMWHKNVPVTANGKNTLTLSFLNDGNAMDADHKTHSRRTFDLQLPADVYINCDDEGQSEREIVGESSSTSMFPLIGDHDNDLRLALGTSTSFSYRENTWKLDFRAQNGVGTTGGLANLNEPATENFFESFEENPTGSSISFRRKHNEKGTYPNVLYTYMKQTTGETPSIMKLFSQDFSQVNFLKPSEAMQLNSSPSEKWQCNGDFGADASAYQNDFRQIAFHKPNLNSRLDSNTTSNGPIMNSNQALLDEVQICSTAQNNSVILDSKGKRIFGFSIFDDTKPAACIDLNSDPSSCEIDLEALDEALAKEAAESIIRISSTKLSHLDDISCRPFDTLHWFAKVVSCEENSIKESSDHELDLFEQTTLDLEETKLEEYSCGQSDAMTMQLRMGQGTKRRQRRDFRRDILPGLASLSRHEAAEDIQTIAGLMRSTGQSWHATNSRARSRRPVAEALESPPQPGITGAEVLAERGNIVGWGRTTRRCRRQRCPPIANARTSIT